LSNGLDTSGKSVIRVSRRVQAAFALGSRLVVIARIDSDDVSAYRPSCGGYYGYESGPYGYCDAPYGYVVV